MQVLPMAFGFRKGPLDIGGVGVAFRLWERSYDLCGKAYRLGVGMSQKFVGIGKAWKK